MHRVLGHRFRRTSLWITGCIGCLVGLGLARRGLSATAAAASVSLVLCIALAPRRGLSALIAVVLASACLGLWRGAEYRQLLSGYTPLYDRSVSLRLTVLNDATYAKTKQLSFDANNIRLADGHRLPGRLTVSGFGLNGVFYGDELQVTGRLKPTQGSAQGRLSFAQLKLIRHHPSWIGEVRRRFSAGMQNALPEPLASFAMGLLVGQRATLPADVKNSLLVVGLTHIIAVSGYNLTIILRASRRLLAGRSMRLATFLSLVLIVVFLMLTGLSASIVRAALVSTLSIWASYYGRNFRPLLLILLVATGTALVNPTYEWSDAGWYLSFLAFGGVMILSPLLAARLPRRVQQSTVLMITVESLAAELATLPYLLHTFGQMSLVGLLANTLIAGLIPLAMLLSTIAGLSGMLLPALAGWAAWPALLVLTYLLDTAQLLSRYPHIFLKGLSLSGAATIVLYAVVLMLWAILHFKKPVRARIITDKNTVSSALPERFHII